MPEQQPKLPIECAIETIKQSITQYANQLGQQYGIPSVLIVNVLQEIVYETKINNLVSGIQELQIATGPVVKTNTIPNHQAIPDSEKQTPSSN